MPTEQQATASLTLFSPQERLSPEEAVAFSRPSAKYLAWLDVKEGLKKWPIWLMLAYQDIKLRYRRSVLGPFWLTLSMAITVYSMGFLYGHLFHTELQRYYPFLVTGMLSWSLLSTLITDLTDGMTSAEAYAKQIKLPFTLSIHRIASRNILIFFHNIFVFIPVIAIFHQYAKVNFYDLLLFPNLAIIYVNAVSYGLILGIIGARYRDISQIIKSLVQVILFVTPVMWVPELISPKHQFLINLNPFYAFIELIRAPLFGTTPTLMNMFVVGIVTVAGIVVSSVIFIRYRARIVYWL